MTSRPAVSVIIPAYNAGKTLCATLQSLAAQTLQDFEAVVVDDGSTDSTLDVARLFANGDARVRVIHQAHQGVAEARNVAIRATTAPLIATLDADDIWHPTFLRKLSDALGQSGNDTLLAYANSRVIDMTGMVLEDAPSSEFNGWVFNQLMLGNFIGNGSAMMFRRDTIARIGGYDSSLDGSEDWLVALKIAALGKFVGIKEYLVGYRVVPGQLSANTLRMRRSRLQVLNAVLGEFDEHDVRSARWALGTAHAKLFLHEARFGTYFAAARHLLRALCLDIAGTGRLLFGRERMEWFEDILTRSPAEGTHVKFELFDPREGQWNRASSRLDKALEWDLAIGPVRQTKKSGAASGLR